MDEAYPPPAATRSADEHLDPRLRDRIAALPEPQAARLQLLRRAMREFAVWEGQETSRLLHRGCVSAPLLLLLSGGILWVFVGLPVALSVLIGLWTSNVVVVALLMSRLSANVERNALERFDGFAGLSTDDDVTVAVLLAIPEALAGPERLHHVLSSLLIRGGVGAPEVTDAVKTYRSFAKTLR